MSSTTAPKQEESRSTPVQWSQVIDPALQQQSATPTQTPNQTPSQTYQYPSYFQNYGQYNAYSHTGAYGTQSSATAASSSATTSATQSRAPAPVTAAAPAAGAGQLDTADVATLNDALGSAGVDLKAEEEGLQRSSDRYSIHSSYDDRSHKQPTKPNFDTRFLGPRLRDIAKKHKVVSVPEESVNYVALALRTRLQDLVTSMIAASAHRTDTAFDRAPSLYEDGTPMWSVTVQRDVAKQLAALERSEREEEMRIRRERKELAAAQVAAGNVPTGPLGAASAMDGEEEEGPKKKKKKVDGPGVTAKNMSEEQRKKMSNAAASHAMGGAAKQYSWMTAGSSSAAAAKPRTNATSASSAPSPATGGGLSATTPGAWTKPYQNVTKAATPMRPEDSKKMVTLRDALFVVEKERGHGGGRGAARGWT
ncbi:unnamed protein product [Peniophora sp. CBMAI 1063]|nr:unnamed protein product [Peniophora sp. CBMAI 1063]